MKPSNTSTLVKPLHSYTQPGNYVVTLIVTDDDDLTGVAAVTISVIDNETVKPDEKPEERELPLMFLTMLFIGIIAAIIVFTR